MQTPTLRFPGSKTGSRRIDRSNESMVCAKMSGSHVSGQRATTASLPATISTQVRPRRQLYGLAPCPANIMLGERLASMSYVRSKLAQNSEARMCSFDRRLPDRISKVELMTLVTYLKSAQVVHGILIQLLFPQQIDSKGNRCSRHGQIEQSNLRNHAGYWGCGPRRLPAGKYGRSRWRSCEASTAKIAANRLCKDLRFRQAADD